MQEKIETIRIEYKQSAEFYLLSIIFSVAMIFLLLYFTFVNPVNFSYRNGPELGDLEMNIIRVIGIIGFAALLMLNIYGFLISGNIDRQIIIDDSSITAPKSLYSSTIKTIMLSDIKKVDIKSKKNIEFFRIWTENDKLQIVGNALPDKVSVHEVHNLIKNRINLK